MMAIKHTRDTKGIWSCLVQHSKGKSFGLGATKDSAEVDARRVAKLHGGR